MAASYRNALERIRRAFPQPVSDPIHDSYFVHSIMRALDQVDGLKMKLPTLGPVISGDFAEAENAAIPASPSSVEEVTSDLVGYLRGMTISSHPHTQQNVIAPPTIPSLIAVLLASLHNPNIAWDEYSRLVALAEVEAVGITARLVGYDPGKAGGAFTFGGTGTSLYGVKIGLEKACPGAMQTGVSDDVAVLVSDAGHYCAHNIVGWLGMGTDQRQMPYLYHFGDHRPGMYTLETSRAGTGPLAALANYRLFGEQGMRVVIGHIVEMTQLLREHLEGHEAITVLNRDNFGTVTLFRVYPPEVDTFAIKRQEFDDPAFRDSLLAHNEYNRKVFDYVHAEAMAGRGIVISSTDCYRHTRYQEPIVALKSFIVSPFVDEGHVHTVVAKVLEAREKVV